MKKITKKGVHQDVPPPRPLRPGGRTKEFDRSLMQTLNLLADSGHLPLFAIAMFKQSVVGSFEILINISTLSSLINLSIKMF